MNLKDLITSSSIEKGLIAKHDRQNKFRLRRVLEGDGFHTFILENIHRKEKINIRSFLFDRFKTQISLLDSNDIENNQESEVRYKTTAHFKIKSSESNIIIQEIQPSIGSTGYLSLHREAIPALKSLLYSENLTHPNEVLDRIINYHKLFQFTFESGSESITSDLAIRKNVLSQTEHYVPSLAKQGSGLGESFKDQFDFKEKDDYSRPENQEEEDDSLFKPRLGERSGDKSYKVDFEKLFKGNQNTAEKLINENTRKKKKKSTSNSFQIPLLSTDIKLFQQVPFKCEFSKDEIEDFREAFLKNREEEIYIGFEIIDGIYRTEGGKLSTFKFPLYYLKVKIHEAGRNIILTPTDNGRVFLNHLAIANMIEKFSKAKGGPSGLDEFFQNLLAQNIEIDGKLSRVYLSRFLPHKEEVYQKTREILLGFPGENGLGGLLGNLKVLGIECDLESVFLYKTPKISSPVSAALEEDLGTILDLATHKPAKFNKSLLGQFLSPGLAQNVKSETFCRTPWIPASLPKSTKRLIDKLNSNDLMLLEGPPGTGKTFSIMNLFIHCLCTNKRLLIVSDQMGAIHALTEKIQEYLMGKDRDSAESKNMELLWRSAIKVVDQLPNQNAKLSTWVNDLRRMLGTDNAQEGFWPDKIENLPSKLDGIDKEIRAIKVAIEKIMDRRLGPDADFRNRVTPKRLHATTVDDIDHLVSFLKFVKTDDKKGSTNKNIRPIKKTIRDFIKHREFIIESSFKKIYDFFEIPETIDNNVIEKILFSEAYLHTLIKTMPRTQKSFRNIQNKSKEDEISQYISKAWKKNFPENSNWFVKTLRFTKSLFKHPLRNDFQKLFFMVQNQKELFSHSSNINTGVIKQLRTIHTALSPNSEELIPLSLEICRFSTNKKDENPNHSRYSIQEYLERIAYLYHKRDKVIKSQFIMSLGEIAKKSMYKNPKDNTSLVTSISSILDSLKTHNTIDSGAAFMVDLKEKLAEAFPIWVCRKQAVPFLFPCVEQSFDLVIVDEATQCGVDDALPLLYRAKKLIVVGDEKQTVLAKNSVIDDYLFHEFNLEEHLRSTQARGFKGGGSQIFSLVKGIKQAHVMLDEHYRCPPDIIQYSNHYVYHDELKKMQWQHEGNAKSMIIDYSEEKAPATGRVAHGQYKGIETGMVDRFLKYVSKTIVQLEKELGHKINVETDVALCYFLLKNEPYIKRVKGEFLTKLNRGEDILDGAGAALQGKERDFIFYFWDINRSNMMAFRQGDDPDKRKGELNVLMSRPKIRAYHFLHKNFKDLNHSTASITDFLWKAYGQQKDKQQKSSFVKREQDPGTEFIPWRRSSGQLMYSIISHMMGDRFGSRNTDNFYNQYSVSVGDAKYNVDLMLSAKSSTDNFSVGMVDLCGFDANKNSADEIIDYYFQLQRATPKIKPVFLFMHELADEKSRAFKRLSRVIDKASRNKKSSKAS